MPRKPHRQSVTFSSEAVDVLNELAEKRGVSLSEVVRTALNREKWFDQALDNGTFYYKPNDQAEPHPVQFVN